MKRQYRARRSYTDEFKAGAVRLVLEEGKTVAQVARDLDLTQTAFRKWVERARADQGKGKPGALTTAERDELAGLRNFTIIAGWTPYILAISLTVRSPLMAAKATFALMSAPCCRLFAIFVLLFQERLWSKYYLMRLSSFWGAPQITGHGEARRAEPGPVH